MGHTIVTVAAVHCCIVKTSCFNYYIWHYISCCMSIPQFILLLFVFWKFCKLLIVSLHFYSNFHSIWCVDHDRFHTILFHELMYMNSDFKDLGRGGWQTQSWGEIVAFKGKLKRVKTIRNGAEFWSYMRQWKIPAYFTQPWICTTVCLSVQCPILLYLFVPVGGTWVFEFAVKFYPPEPSHLSEDITR